MRGCLRMAAASLLPAILLMQGSLSWADTSVVTDDGKEYVGDVIDAGVNTLTMKLAGTGYQIVPMKSITLIKVDVTDGAPVEGKLIDWSEGELIVRVGDRDVGVRDGIITSVVDVGVAAGGPEVSTPPPQPAEQEAETPAVPLTPPSAPTNATM